MRRVVLGCVCSAIAMVVALPPTATAAGEDRWALIVGVDRFLGRTRPNIGSVGDASDVQSLLLQRGWTSDHIRVLTDSGATASAFRDGMRWLADRCGPTSRCVFHYSGHVKLFSRDRDRDGEVLDEYLWPHDNAHISDAEFASYMQRLQGHAWIDVSGCEAAGFDDGISSPRRLFTGSSLEHEKSYEYPGWSNSVFTGLLVDKGMLQGQADANGDRWVTMDEAFTFASERAPQMTVGQPKGTQHPYRAGGSETGDFFAPPPPPPQPAPAASRTCLLPFLCL